MEERQRVAGDPQTPYDGLDVDTEPPLTPNEAAELAVKTTAAIIEAFEAGLTDHGQALTELRQMSELTGLFAEITDDDIQEAMLEPPPMAEVPGVAMPGQPMPGGAPGAPAPGQGAAPAGGPQSIAPKMPNAARELKKAAQPSAGGFAGDAEFKESDHPRDEAGKFGAGGGGSSSAAPKRDWDTMSEAIAMSSPNGKTSKRAHAANMARLQESFNKQRAVEAANYKPSVETQVKDLHQQRDRLLNDAKIIRGSFKRGPCLPRAPALMFFHSARTWR